MRTTTTVHCVSMSPCVYSASAARPCRLDTTLLYKEMDIYNVMVWVFRFVFGSSLIIYVSLFLCCAKSLSPRACPVCVCVCVCVCLEQPSIKTRIPRRRLAPNYRTLHTQKKTRVPHSWPKDLEIKQQKKGSFLVKFVDQTWPQNHVF